MTCEYSKNDQIKDQELITEKTAPFTCVFCGLPSFLDPSDQSPPPDYCHESDHGTSEDYE